MQHPEYYREHAARARRLKAAISHPEMIRTLDRLARDYDDIATDLENGAVEIVHPELLPQRQHPG